MNKLNIQHYTNEDHDRVTQMTEMIDKQTVIAKSTHIKHKKCQHIGFVKLKRGREYDHEFYVDHKGDIDLKIDELNRIPWIEQQMKEELGKLIREMGNEQEEKKLHPTLFRTKIN
ncbi:hypothetical protein [Piscibacillus halophilus]|uniref:Uncharacterized protein n=1 Tax=Piscibacillus halophilus TaxID=571933 RepID=A0A1H9IL10_9BACI|nr:hypothetical protein [Piscibacillus halophilus]SEQ75293.1 hypothetical protein SAMN05216362_12535 [Piscibacillus halophilus]